jgi:hypothetical protein
MFTHLIMIQVKISPLPMAFRTPDQRIIFGVAKTLYGQANALTPMENRGPDDKIMLKLQS